MTKTCFREIYFPFEKIFSHFFCMDFYFDEPAKIGGAETEDFMRNGFIFLFYLIYCIMFSCPHPEYPQPAFSCPGTG